jgi:hypothetical protein
LNSLDLTRRTFVTVTQLSKGEMREAVLSGAVVPNLVREAKREEDVAAGSLDWNRYGQSSQITLARSQVTTLQHAKLTWTV